MKTITFSYLTLLAALLSPMAANALPVVQTATCVGSTLTCATGVTGLESLGMTYNVDFVGGSYNTRFAANDPFFLGDQAGGQAASEAIAALFNGLSIAGVIEAGTRSNAFLVPTDNTVNPTGVGGANNGPGTTWNPNIGWGLPATAIVEDVSESLNIEYRWAVFEKVNSGEVPEPASIALFVIGLAGLGWSRRKKA